MLPLESLAVRGQVYTEHNLFFQKKKILSIIIFHAKPNYAGKKKCIERTILPGQRHKSATAAASHVYSFQNWVRCFLVWGEFVKIMRELAVLFGI